jgi:hypothetical protein
MDARYERGLQLAQRGDIVKHANGWKVRSQSGNGSYFVHLDDQPSCTCPDFELRQQKCKTLSTTTDIASSISRWCLPC